MKYLGAPVGGSGIRVRDLNFIEERNLKHFDGWQGGSMSLVGRKVQIDSSLNGIYNYYMSLFRFTTKRCVRVGNGKSTSLWDHQHPCIGYEQKRVEQCRAEVR
jgi:hypothetical protein